MRRVAAFGLPRRADHKPQPQTGNAAAYVPQPASTKVNSDNERAMLVVMSRTDFPITRLGTRLETAILAYMSKTILHPASWASMGKCAQAQVRVVLERTRVDLGVLRNSLGCTAIKMYRELERPRIVGRRRACARWRGKRAVREW